MFFGIFSVVYLLAPGGAEEHKFLFFIFLAHLWCHHLCFIKCMCCACQICMLCSLTSIGLYYITKMKCDQCLNYSANVIIMPYSAYVLFKAQLSWTVKCYTVLFSIIIHRYLNHWINIRINIIVIIEAFAFDLRDHRKRWIWGLLCKYWNIYKK